MMTLMRKARMAAHLALSMCPSFVKLPIYRRLFGFRIGDGVRIGFSVLDVDELELQAGARIGHGNLLTRTRRVCLGKNAQIGHANVVRGGDEVRLGDYALVMRFN